MVEAAVSTREVPTWVFSPGISVWGATLIGYIFDVIAFMKRSAMAISGEIDGGGRVLILKARGVTG